MRKIVILGAGLAGLSAAYQLEQNGEHGYTVLEKENTVGGLCRTVYNKGFLFDYTGHLLHPKKKHFAGELIKKLLKGNLKIINRDTWIFSEGVSTRYPFQENVYGLSPEVVKECVLGYIEAERKHKTKENQSFHDWIICNFGKGIAKHFMVPYNKKMRSCDNLRKLTTEQLLGYVPRPDMKEVINGALFSKRSKLGYNASFYYPEQGGIQVLPDALAASCRNIELGCTVTRIDLKKKKIKSSKFPEGQPYDILVSSIPLKELILNIIEDVPENVAKAARGLKYNSVLNINFGIRRKKITDRHWIYFPEDKFSFYRAGFLTNFSKSLAPGNMSSIYTEISYKPEDREKTLADIRNKSKKAWKDLIAAEVIDKDDEMVVSQALNIDYAFIKFDREYSKNIKTINNYLNKNGIHIIGRYGRWEYSAMEDAILEGRIAADLIIKGKSCIH